MEATKYSCISCSLGHNLSCGHQIHPVGVALDFSQCSPALLYSVINQQYMLYNLNIGYWELDDWSTYQYCHWLSCFGKI